MIIVLKHPPAELIKNFTFFNTTHVWKIYMSFILINTDNYISLRIRVLKELTLNYFILIRLTVGYYSVLRGQKLHIYV